MGRTFLRTAVLLVLAFGAGGSHGAALLSFTTSTAETKVSCCTAEAGFGHGDIDGDGDEEMVVVQKDGSTTGNHWTLYEYDDSAATYRASRSSAVHDPEISALNLLYFPATGWLLVVGFADGTIEILDPGSFTQLALRKDAAAAVVEIIQGDADNDAQEDIVVVTQAGTILYDPFERIARRTIGYSSAHLRIGNVDDDAARELVYSDGWVVEQKLGKTTLQWDYSLLGFGSLLELADVDDDGRDEILGTKGAGFRAFDADLQSIQWSRLNGTQIEALVIADLQGDATPELIAAGGRQGIQVLDAVSGDKLDRIEPVERFFTRMTLLDADGDGVLEAAGGADERLRIADFASGTTLWQSIPLFGPFLAVDVGDIDGDRRRELVYSSPGPYRETNTLCVRDAQTLDLRWQIAGEYPSPFIEVVHRDLAVVDIDGDGAAEILLAGSYGSYPEASPFYVLDGKTREVRHKHHLTAAGRVDAIAAGDIDGDGDVEAVLAGWGGSWEDAHYQLFVLDPASGSVEWQADLPGSRERALDVGIANIDADPALEIVVSRGNITIFDGVTHESLTTEREDFRAFTFLGGPKKKRVRLIAGTSAGEIRRVLGASEPFPKVAEPCAGEILALRRLRRGRIAYACDLRIGTLVLKTGEGWESEEFSETPAASGNLPVWRSKGRFRMAAGMTRSLLVLAEDTGE